jgi:hypothetical protein
MKKMTDSEKLKDWLYHNRLAIKYGDDNMIADYGAFISYLLLLQKIKELEEKG